MTEKNIWKEIIAGKNKEALINFFEQMVLFAIAAGLISCMLNNLTDYKLNNIPCDKIGNTTNIGLILNSSIDNICNYTFIDTASYYKYHGIGGVLNISVNGFLEVYQRIAGSPPLIMFIMGISIIFLCIISQMEKRIILSIKRKVSFIESALIKTIFILLIFGICLVVPILIPVIYCILCIFVFGLVLWGLFIFIIPAIIGLYWYNYKYMNSINYNKKNKKINKKKISKRKMIR